MTPLLRISLVAAVLAFVSVSARGQALEPNVPSPAPPTVFESPELVQRYQDSISPEDLAAQLFLFASDFFEGRETTTRGQKLAAYYLASQYRKLGLEPRGTAAAEHPYAPEAFFQPFSVHGQRMNSAHLSVILQGDTASTSIFSSEAQDGDAYLVFGTRPQTDGSVVFAGYGISDEELEYDDFVALNDKSINVAGKWLLIFRDEPLLDDSRSLLPTQDGGPSVWSKSVYQKLRAAYRHAVPKGFLVVGDVGPRVTESVPEAAERAAAGLESVGSLSLLAEGTQSRPPLFMISSDLANKILSPSGRTVAEIKQEIDSSLRPVVFELPGVTVASRLDLEPFTATTENVLAFIEGSDPELKQEVVVISSHYDHIGLDPTEEDDQVNNGADDDGSGTVATLEIAEAFMRAKREGYGPRRSIIFLNVSGEEKGLLGSEYYA
ncbi:MAG: M28 family peptidase, partial [Rhodothermales bacterium]